MLNSQVKSLLFSKLLYVVKFGFNISDGRIPSEQEKFSQDSWTFRSGSSDTESFEGKSLGKIKKFLVSKTDAFFVNLVFKCGENSVLRIQIVVF